MRIGNLSIVYGVVAMLSALLYITYILFILDIFTF